MIMRYHWGLSIGHTYLHIQPVSMTCWEADKSVSLLPQQPNHDSDMLADDRTSHIDDLGHLDDSLESSKFEFDPRSLNLDESDCDSNNDSDKESDSVLGDYVDMDGWDNADNSLEEYKF